MQLTHLQTNFGRLRSFPSARRLLSALAVIGLLVASLGVWPQTPVDAAVPPGYFETKILPSDSAIRQSFGRSVAVSGDTFVVGAPQHDGSGSIGTDSGAAYVYAPDGIGGYAETQLFSSDIAPDDQYGSSVAIAGDTIVVGSIRDDDNGADSGSVYVHTPDGTGGYTETKLTASDGKAGDFFGISVAAFGDTIVVGSQKGTGVLSDSGAAYIYEPDGSGGYTETKLTASDGGSADAFGLSVDIDSSAIVVGAPLDDNTNGNQAGSVYVYIDDGAGGYTETMLTASSGNASNQFGFSVAVENGVIVAGEPNASGGPNGGGSGLAHIYTPDGSGGYTEDTIFASDRSIGEGFGRSVDIAGGVVVSGAPDLNSGDVPGAAYRYEPDGSGGYTETRFSATDDPAEDHYGDSVALSSDIFVVGAGFEGGRDVEIGAAYVYSTSPPPVLCDGQVSTIVGTAGDDMLVGTAGVDVIHGLGGNDNIQGLEGEDVICGGDGDDYIDAGAQRDTVFGENGHDTLLGRGGQDTLEGGNGDDIVRGNFGNDTLRGNGGFDTIHGGPGNDDINAGWGNDTVDGEDGDDTINGNVGNDVLKGGLGTNTCTNGELLEEC